jgi:hypothetical protein
VDGGVLVGGVVAVPVGVLVGVLVLVGLGVVVGVMVGVGPGGASGSYHAYIRSPAFSSLKLMWGRSLASSTSDLGLLGMPGTLSKCQVLPSK